MTTLNFPAQSTAFIGREAELAEIAGLLAQPECRLLTLIGPGGIGKTRLALEAANRILLPHGAYFAPLQSLASPETIIPTIATSLEFSLYGESDPKAQLHRYLREKSLLLVLDNFEHLLDGVDLLPELLEAATQVKLLVTSRERLNLREEWVLDVQGLPYPQQPESSDGEDYSAVQLFNQSACRAGYTPADADYAAVMHICRMLEGLPLAIELAAGWVRAMSCGQIADEIEHSLDLLSTNLRNFPQKHRSMRTVFEHSWAMLTDDEKNAFMKLSVFHGGFMRESAEAVAGASLPILVSLVDKSLLRVEANGRYGIHELLRQYASQKLEQMPDIRENLLDRHSEYYTEFLSQQESTIHISNQANVLIELDNVRIAWKHAAQRCNQKALLQAASSLYWLYHFQGWFGEGASMFYLAEEAISEMSMTDDNRFLLGMMQMFHLYYKLRQSGPSPSIDVASALSLWEGLEERPEMGLPLSRATFMLFSQYSDPKQIVVLARQSLAIHQRYDDLSGVAIALATLASVYCDAFGEFAEAQQLLEQALAIDREIGFILNAGWCQSILSTIANLQGRYKEAKAHSQAWVAYRQAGGIRSALDTALHTLGLASLELDEDATARRHFEESIEVASDQQQQVQMAEAYASLGIVAAFQDEINIAAAYFENSQADLRSAGLNPFSFDQEPESFGFLALLLGHFDYALAHYEAILAAYRGSGYRLPLIYAHCRAGHALIGLGDKTQATPHLFEAFSEAANIGAFQVLLEALLGIAQLSLVTPTLAVELFAFISEQPASNRYSRTLAKRLLEMNEFSLTHDEFSRAIDRGKTLTFKAVTQLVEQLHPGAETAQDRANSQLIHPLNKRELEILHLAADGMNSREIADRIYLSVETVRWYFKEIYSKLDVHSRAELIQIARNLNLLT